MKDSESKLRVHIVGIHGVPARYGGFETLADFLCQYLEGEYDLTVYCNANKYPEQTKEYFGAHLKYLKLDASGLKGIFYDLVTYINALVNADVILYLCPVASGFMTPLKYLTGKKVIVNHGGLNEWEREKLNWVERKWAKFNHSVAARFADVNIVDNYMYKQSILDTFDQMSEVIKYGGDHVQKVPVNDKILIKKYPFVKDRYAVSVSRAQLDNNIHVVLEAFELFTDYKIVIVSNWNVSKYGIELKEKYSTNPNMILLDAIYDKRELDYIRGNAYVYIHSHSRCGTAPSLVEAMCLKQAIISYDVATNRETTKGEAIFFHDPTSLKNILENITAQQINTLKAKMYSIAIDEYKWKTISQQYSEIINMYKIPAGASVPIEAFTKRQRREAKENYAWSSITNRSENNYLPAVAISAIEKPVFQPLKIRILTIGTLRNKPALALMGPELVTTFKSPAQYLMLKEMRNKKPVRPHSAFMGKADLLIEVPVVNFSSRPAQDEKNRDMQKKRSAS